MNIKLRRGKRGAIYITKGVRRMNDCPVRHRNICRAISERFWTCIYKNKSECPTFQGVFALNNSRKKAEESISASESDVWHMGSGSNAIMVNERHTEM
jgi:hypothetical protein